MPDLMVSIEDAPTRNVEPTSQGFPPSGPPWTPRLIALLIGSLVGAWLIPAACMALGVGWLLPLAIWVGTASLMRSGRTLLDRLVLAMCLLVGLTCAAVMLLSLWPATLEPVPVTAIGLTVLIAFAALTGRRPQFPLRTMRPADFAVIAGTLAATVLVLRPFLGRDFADRLSILAIGGDLARHFTIYDTMRTVGGFLFMHRDVPMPNVDAGYESYPQGSHLMYALIANMMPQGADRADAAASFDLLITFDIASFVAMCLATIWACRWACGPALRGWVSVPFLGAIAGYMFFGTPATLLTRGFPSEMVGWALLAVLVAIVVRPVKRLWEQCVMVAALVVGISFTYFLFLPFAGLIALVWVYQARRQLLRHRLVVGLIALATGALSVVSPLVNTLFSVQGVGDRLLLPGSINKVDRATVVAWLFIAVALPLLTWRRSSAWRTALVLIVLSTLPPVALFGIHVIIGNTSDTYYLDKLLHEALVVTVVLSGSILLALMPAAARRRAGPWTRFGFATVLSFALFVSVTDLQFNGPEGSGRLHFQQRNAIWEAGDGAEAALRRFPVADDRLVWVQLYTRADLGGRDASHWSTLYTAVLQRNYRASWSLFYWANPWEASSPTETAEFLMTSPKPLRVLVNDTMSLEYFNDIKSRYPALDLEVVDMRERR